jgi:HlyD family secretion protein
MKDKKDAKKGQNHSLFSGLPKLTKAHIALLFLVMTSACRQPDSLIKAAGTVDGETTLVTSLLAGQIIEFNLQEGAKVQKGQVAARLDSAKIEKKIEGLSLAERELKVSRAKIERQIERLEKNEIYWRGQVARLKKLAQEQAVSGDELERARLQLDEAEAELAISRYSLESLRLQQLTIQNQREELELQLKDYTITIPADGVVLQSYVTSGEIIYSGKPLAQILLDDSLFVETFLEEKELSRIKLNQEASILVDGQVEELKGEIYFISREAEFSPKYIISEKERKALLYQVKIKIRKAQEILKLGMPVTVIIKPEAEFTP